MKTYNDYYNDYLKYLEKLSPQARHREFLEFVSDEDYAEYLKQMPEEQKQREWLTCMNDTQYKAYLEGLSPDKQRQAHKSLYRTHPKERYNEYLLNKTKLVKH